MKENIWNAISLISHSIIVNECDFHGLVLLYVTFVMYFNGRNKNIHLFIYLFIHSLMLPWQFKIVISHVKL